MSIEICQKYHRYDEKFNQLPPDQSDDGRHCCAGCAYDQGYNHGIKRQTPCLKYNTLLRTQAGTVRHKSVEYAYCLGYVDGFNETVEKI